MERVVKKPVWSERSRLARKMSVGESVELRKQEEEKGEFFWRGVSLEEKNWMEMSVSWPGGDLAGQRLGLGVWLAEKERSPLKGTSWILSWFLGTVVDSPFLDLIDWFLNWQIAEQGRGKFCLVGFIYFVAWAEPRARIQSKTFEKFSGIVDVQCGKNSTFLPFVWPGDTPSSWWIEF